MIGALSKLVFHNKRGINIAAWLLFVLFMSPHTVFAQNPPRERTISTPELVFTGQLDYTPPRERIISTPELVFTGQRDYAPPRELVISTSELIFTGQRDYAPPRERVIGTSELIFAGQRDYAPPRERVIGTSELVFTGQRDYAVPRERTITTAQLIFTGQREAKPRVTIPEPATEILAQPATKIEPQRRASKKSVISGNTKLVSIRLLQQKRKNGFGPFNLADIKSIGDRSTRGAPPPAATDTPSSHEAEPVPASSTPHDDQPPSSQTRTTAPTSDAVFTCANKPDGNYCKDSNTQVFCYHNTIANSQDCPSGCDDTTKACNAYKP